MTTEDLNDRLKALEALTDEKVVLEATRLTNVLFRTKMDKLEIDEPKAIALGIVYIGPLGVTFITTNDEAKTYDLFRETCEQIAKTDQATIDKGKRVVGQEKESGADKPEDASAQETQAQGEQPQETATN